jgi:restriction system protein
LLGVVVTIASLALFGDGGNVGSAATVTLWCYVLVGSPIFIFLYHKGNIENFLRAFFTDYLVYTDNVSAYRANLAAWEFTNSECGLGYWRALRGIDFEHAVALLFRRRNCDVTITKSSGDGGVDLVLNVGGDVLWCQCKGHAKPVSVASIREIAGVCSRSQAIPVMLAVNGYTVPAIAAADELQVTCLDAPDLCNLARLEAITSVGEIVREIIRTRAG